MSDTTATTGPGPGHNLPDPVIVPNAVLDQEIVAKAKITAREAIAALKALKRPVETVAEAEALNDAIGKVKSAWTEVEKARKTAKKPFDDAVDVVQRTFTTILETLKKFETTGKEEADVFRRAEQARADALAEEVRQKARDAEAAAFAAKQLAEAQGDDIAAAEAEQALEEAAKVTAKADRIDTTVRIGSATGETRTMAARTVKTVTITNLRAVVLHFIDSPELADLMQTLAARAVRAAGYVEGSIPGINVEKDKKI